MTSSVTRRAHAQANPLPTPERKTCSTCRVEKPSSDFGTDSTRRDGLYPQCKGCRHRPTVEEQVGYGRTFTLKKYGLTVAQWNDLLLSQSSRCALCGAAEPGTKHGWQTDHCHATGKVRGILCLSCNLHVGRIERGWAPPSVERLAAYLGGLELTP